MKIGDVSRPRRFTDPVRRRWYAYHRAVRFANRMGFGPGGRRRVADTNQSKG